MEKLTEQQEVRLEKLKELEKKNRNPSGQKFDVSMYTDKLHIEFGNKEKEDLAELNAKVSIAGRVMTKRDQGKAGFINLKDEFGIIQIYIAEKKLKPEEFEDYAHLDLGDIIGIEGEVFKTNVGELSIRATSFKILTKALRPLPDKHSGLKDVEEIYRRRYVDLIVNDESRARFKNRSKIVSGIRHYLDSRGYLEVETPILQTIAGGASARPFITHHNTLDIQMYLRIATELHLKRLIVGGFHKVYEIGRLFRNEGISIKHNPEFTTIEIYEAYGDMQTMMDLTEEMIRELNFKINEDNKIDYLGQHIDFTNFEKIHMVDMIKNITGVDFWEEMTIDEAMKIAKEHNVNVDDHHFSVGHIINEFFEQKCEELIINPTFVWGHPVEISPLAKQNDEDKRFTDRFELFIIGREYANAFSELNNPLIQRERFMDQLKVLELGNDEATKFDYDFIEALEYGMPPTGGLGIGIDRLVMLLTNARSIRDVILFPTMKESHNKDEK